MLVDVAYMVVVLIAVIQGYRRGIIVGVFSLLAVVLGVMAALKFSVAVSGWLQHFTGIHSAWASFVAFAIVLMSVVLLVRLIATILHEAVKMLLLGWADKLGGIILYVLIYTIVFSVLLFFANYIHLLNQNVIESSKSYSFVEPLGPAFINKIGEWLPWFKDMFKKLEDFFQPPSNSQYPTANVFYGACRNYSTGLVYFFFNL